MDSITISIADIPITLTLDDCDAKKRAWIVERYADFTVPEQSALVTVRVRVEPGAAYIPINIAPTWQIRTALRNGRIEFESYYESGWVDRASGQGELVMREQGDPENFLRVLYAWLCVEQGGLLIHAAGVISHGRGFLFYGHSESGKTTVSRFSLDRTVLSDDIVIVKKVDGIYRIYGVPFRGDMPEAPRTNASAELVGLCILVKAPEHRLEPLDAPIAAGRLASCVPFVMTQPDNVARVMDICADLARSVPPRALYFKRDSEFWRLLDGIE